MEALKFEDQKENILLNFLLRGPPGTGKSTTVKRLDEIFYDMDFLSKAEVVECSATDVMTSISGQAGPKDQ